MPDNKKTNAVNFKNMTPQERKEQMATWKQERTKSQLKKKWANQQTKGNNKTNKNHRNTVKNKKRMTDRFGNPTKENKKTNPNLAFMSKTDEMPLNIDKAIANETATRFNGVREDAKAKIELVARTFAETGWKKLYEGVAWLVSKYQNDAEEN